jgi:hypothetical protein
MENFFRTRPVSNWPMSPSYDCLPHHSRQLRSIVLFSRLVAAALCGLLELLIPWELARDRAELGLTPTEKRSLKEFPRHLLYSSTNSDLAFQEREAKAVPI